MLYLLRVVHVEGITFVVNYLLLIGRVRWVECVKIWLMFLLS